MATDVAERLLDDAVDVNREIRRDVRDRSAGGQRRPNPGLTLELLDRASEGLFQPEVVEHTRVEPLRLRADAIERGLRDPAHVIELLRQRRIVRRMTACAAEQRSDGGEDL